MLTRTILLSWWLVWLICIPASGQELHLVYPPQDHVTASRRIYFIGSIPVDGHLSVNGRAVERSERGYFAWTTPLQTGGNRFNWTLERPGVPPEQLVRRIVYRPQREPVPTDRVYLAIHAPLGVQQVLPGEVVCIEGLGTPGGQMQAQVGSTRVSMTEQPAQPGLADTGDLLGGSAALPGIVGLYSGCLSAVSGWQNETAQLTFRWRGQVVSQNLPAGISTLPPGELRVVEVTAPEAIVRAGGGPDYARLTPLVPGVRSLVTGVSGEWLRLQGEGWILGRDVKLLPVGTPVPRSPVRALRTRATARASELLIPLQVALPYSVRQEENRLVVTIWGAQSQTDIIRFTGADPLIRSVQWEPVSSEGVRYYIDLREPRQWGYQVRYEGSVLVVAVRHPPKIGRGLAGIQVLLDPGHGGAQAGSIGLSGIPEKTVNLQIALRVRRALEKVGATVRMTRDRDQTLSLEARNQLLTQQSPTIFLSLHNNALPDSGDPTRQFGTSVYWYQLQSRALAESLHQQLLADLKRPDYGLYWDSLAVIRPSAAPAVLVELGFMTHPEEYALLNDAGFQERIAGSIARGLTRWLHSGS